MKATVRPISAASFSSSVEDLRLRRDVEAGDDLVGQHEFRRQRERARDADALALAARQFVAVAAGEALRQADALQRFGDALLEIVAKPVLLQRRGDDARRWCGAG